MRLLFFILFINIVAFSQTDSKELSIDKSTIDDQFEYVLKKSSNYQEYKVVKKTLLYTLKSHVVDSLKKGKSELATYKDLLQKKEDDFIALQKKLEAVNEELTTVTNSKNTIKLFGFPLQRDVYKTILWSLIGILFFTLLYFIYIFRNSNIITQKALSDYNELENEYNNSKTRSLEREQVLNRKLQDELNKQKKSK